MGSRSHGHVRSAETRDKPAVEIESDWPAHRTRLVALTGSIQDEAHAKALLDVFDQVLHKPQTPGQVLEAIQASR